MSHSYTPEMHMLAMQLLQKLEKAREPKKNIFYNIKQMLDRLFLDQ
jgi:hypothetical protein